MRNTIRTILLQSTSVLYENLARPVLFLQSPDAAHERALQLCALLDRYPIVLKHNLLPQQTSEVGGVSLESPLILAAGFVKGIGFASEALALNAISEGVNIIPGWRSVPMLVGNVEFGSFTRYPRLGNNGTVMWRYPSTRSTQNRVGLKNPGAQAAAMFLSLHRNQLPVTFGINIAVSPGVNDLAEEKRHVLESIQAFIARDVVPSWFTLNLSCPNTEDDPQGHQTEDKARILCDAAVSVSGDKPLWVKISPNLSNAQYSVLMRAFANVGVRAVIATNTLSAPISADDTVNAGVGGGCLFSYASEAVQMLMTEKHSHNYSVDVIACGGVLDGATYHAYRHLGAKAVQYWSALIYRGPLAAALIADEARMLETI